MNVTSQPTPDATPDDQGRPSDTLRVEGNKAASRRWIEVFNQRDDAAEADLRTPDFVAYAPASLEPEPLNSEAWTRFLSGFVAGFPDLQLTVEESVGEGDLVAQMIHFEGTHTGDFQGLPPTHRKVTFSGLELNRFVDGRVVEHWFQLDALTLLQQIGLVVVGGPRGLPRVQGPHMGKGGPRGGSKLAVGERVIRPPTPPTRTTPPRTSDGSTPWSLRRTPTDPSGS